MRYSLRTLFIALALIPPIIGIGLPPFIRWFGTTSREVFAPMVSCILEVQIDGDLSHYGGGATQVEHPDLSQLNDGYDKPDYSDGFLPSTTVIAP